MDVLMAHGSRNAIFLVDGPAEAHFPHPDEVARFVVAMNDRQGPFGGGDGLYFIDDSPEVPVIGFYNTDGTSASLCGNGLRCVMRLLMERRGVDHLDVRIGDNTFAGRRGADLAPGVPSYALDLPGVTYTPELVPLAAGHDEIVDEVLPELHEKLRFTALAVPNPHLVAVVDSYDEAVLVELGERIAAGLELFPEGINLSFVLPLSESELFVRTYERGSALTPSCGSGNVASRTAYSRLGYAPSDRHLTLRNVGGPSAVWAESDGHPVLEGNANWMYRAPVDVEALLAGRHPEAELERYPAEEQAYGALWAANRAVLDQAGVSPLP